MSSIAAQLEKSKGLLSALDALTNRKAFTTLCITLVTCALIFGLTTLISSKLAWSGHGGIAALFGFLGGLIAVVLVWTGMSATGFIVNAQMLGAPQPGIGSAFLTALATLPRLLGVLVLLFLTLLGLAIAVALLLLICKIPGLGAFLYTFIFPACIIVSGLALYSAFFITSLAGPAIWNGNTAMQAVTILVSIARQRLIVVVINTLLLMLLVSVVSSVIFGVLAAGMGFTSALSLPIIGADASGFGGLLAMFGSFGFGGGSGGSGHMIAAMIGGGLLFAAAAVLPVLLIIAGNCVIYANTTVGLDTQAVADQIKAAQEKARTSINEAREQMATARQNLANNASSATAPETAAAGNCPGCQTAIGPDDIFCGNCGHKLK